MYCAFPEVACYANDNDAFIPEQWALEGLMQLEEQMVAAALVHRDFEDAVAQYGDTVNTRRPGEFKVRRKSDSTTSLDKQDATSTNVPVKLNQWFYNSFVIKDGEQSMSFQDLVDVYLVPSMRTIARSVDRALLGHVHRFLGSAPTARVGRLQNLLAASSHEVVLEAREKLNSNNAPLDAARSLLLSSMSETALLKNDMFLKANERGDGGEALENARLGRILGFNTFLAQNVPYCNSLGADTVAGAINNATGYPAGTATELTVDGLSAAITAGSYVNVAGNDQPTWATGSTGGSTPTGITLSEALKYAVLDNAVVTVYDPATVDASAQSGTEYAVGYDEQIILDGYTANKHPQVGQLLSIGTSTRYTYTIIESEAVTTTSCKVMLDRPLEAALADGVSVFPGPAGSLNLALHREAIALVTRPLAVPNNRMGVLSGVGSYNDVGMRVSMQYDIDAGGTVVNCDMLAGIKELDTNLAVVLLG